MTKGKTVLLGKYRRTGNITSSSRPITCLILVWKLIAGINAYKIYGHLNQKHLLAEEQTGCRKRWRGTNDLLYTDKAVTREIKSRKKNLTLLWIDKMKADDMFITHSCIAECLDMFGVAENIKTLCLILWKTRRVTLCEGRF